MNPAAEKARDKAAEYARDLFDHSKGKKNPESQDAFNRVQSSLVDSRREVLNEFRQQRGGTLKTICAALGKEKNQISGRITELKRLKLLSPNGMRQDGCAVLVITQKGKEALA